MVTNTKVVDLYGHKPNGKQIFIRTLIRLYPFDPISFFLKEKDINFMILFPRQKLLPRLNWIRRTKLPYYNSLFRYVPISVKEDTRPHSYVKSTLVVGQQENE